jgi:hypothetical protein
MCDPPVTATVAGKRYKISRAPGGAPGTVTERWPGYGLVGSTRTWRGSDWARTVTWWGVRNASGQPGQPRPTRTGSPPAGPR